MPERERTITDMMLRHNLYLQGLKRSVGGDLSRIVIDLDRAIRTLFGRVDIQILGDMPKRDFDRFMVRLRRNVNLIYEHHSRLFVRETKKFIGVEIGMFQSMFRADTAKRIPAPELATMWGRYLRTTNTATGMNLIQGVTSFRNSGLTAIERAARSGYVAKLATVDVLRNIVGIQSRGYQGGVLKRVPSWATSLAGTTFQHGSGYTSNNIGKEYYNQYQWISVMDENTTDICTELNEQVFEYGEGPTPPAHYNCRSETVPYVGDSPPTSLAEWLEDQPGKFLDDVFKAGDRTLDNVKVISLDGFRNKREIILI